MSLLVTCERYLLAFCPLLFFSCLFFRETRPYRSVNRTCTTILFLRKRCYCCRWVSPDLDALDWWHSGGGLCVLHIICLLFGVERRGVLALVYMPRFLSVFFFSFGLFQSVFFVFCCFSCSFCPSTVCFIVVFYEEGCCLPLRDLIGWSLFVALLI